MLSRADRAHGRFRSFLLGSLKNFLANEWDEQKRLKRGGGFAFYSVEELEAANQVAQAATDQLSPEKLFDRRWAEAMLDRMLIRLQPEYEAAGQARRFEVGKGVISQKPIVGPVFTLDPSRQAASHSHLNDVADVRDARCGSTRR